MRYLISQPMILVLALMKSGLALAGGVMTLIPLYANRMFASASAISMAIGVMYSARGLGAALGPILVKKVFGDSTRVLQIAILCSFFLGALSYFLFAQSHSLWWACLSIALATFFGSIIWVFSSALIHLEADSRFLGRVFSTEMALLTLVMALSNWSAGFAMDTLTLTANETALCVVDGGPVSDSGNIMGRVSAVRECTLQAGRTRGLRLPGGAERLENPADVGVRKLRRDQPLMKWSAREIPISK